MGKPKDLVEGNYSSITGDYLKGIKKIEVPKDIRKGNGLFIELIGCNGNNLKNVDLKIPLGKFVCITGVSGSGKSSLINNTLHPILNQFFFRAEKNLYPTKK